MNPADELLKLAVDVWDKPYWKTNMDALMEEAKTYLATPRTEQEPVGFASGEQLEYMAETLYKEAAIYVRRFSSPEKSIPLFLHPAPKRKPLTLGEIRNEFSSKQYISAVAFDAGVRWAERMHGIGDGDE